MALVDLSVNNFTEDYKLEEVIGIPHISVFCHEISERIRRFPDKLVKGIGNVLKCYEVVIIVIFVFVSIFISYDNSPTFDEM